MAIYHPMRYFELDAKTAKGDRSVNPPVVIQEGSINIQKFHKGNRPRIRLPCSHTASIGAKFDPAGRRQFIRFISGVNYKQYFTQSGRAKGGLRLPYLMSIASGRAFYD